MHIIAGSCKGRKILTIPHSDYRPAMSKVRESLFSILESRGIVWSSIRFLDVFAGTGSLGFEALSRGAAHAAFIESDHVNAEYLRKNAAGLDFSALCRIYETDALRILRNPPQEPFHVICVDPPYGKNLFKPALKFILHKNWLAEDGYLIAEIEKKLPVDTDSLPGMELETERCYGNTRILIWKKNA